MKNPDEADRQACLKIGFGGTSGFRSSWLLVVDAHESRWGNPQAQERTGQPAGLKVSDCSFGERVSHKVGFWKGGTGNRATRKRVTALPGRRMISAQGASETGYANLSYARSLAGSMRCQVGAVSAAPLGKLPRAYLPDTSFYYQGTESVAT